MRWDLHGLIIEGTTDDANVLARWQRAFASRPRSTASADIQCHLSVSSKTPAAPAGEPDFRQGRFMAYYLNLPEVVVHFPGKGQLRLDLIRGTTHGVLKPETVLGHGGLEDVVAMSLSPHLRRRGLFLMHAFAAERNGQAVLLVGDTGAGKTTAGMALLAGGWRLLSNDSPILGAQANVFSYPGPLAAHPDTLAMLELSARLPDEQMARAGQKLTVLAEEIWPGVWGDQAPAKAVFFPRVEARRGHAIEPISGPDALRMLLPHAVEQWDRSMIEPHLAVLRQLAETAPAYLLKISPAVKELPSLVVSVLEEEPVTG